MGADRNAFAPIRDTKQALDDFWRVYDAHSELVHARALDAALTHAELSPTARALTPETLAAQARAYREGLRRAIEGDLTARDTYLRAAASAYVEAGVSFADWATSDAAFTDALAPLLVEAYSREPERLIGALRVMRSIARHTTVVLGTAYIEEKERGQEASLRERDQLLASLRFERQRLGALLMRAPAAIIVMRGPEHVVELANDQFFQIIGARDIVGKRAADAFPRVVDQGLIAIFDRVLATGVPFADHALRFDVYRVPEGPPEPRVLDVVYQAIVEADGTRTGVFGHGVDVTERENAAARIRAQFKAMPVPTSAWRRVVRDGQTDFVLEDFNDAAEKMAEGSLEGWRSTTVSKFDERGKDGLLADMTRCLAEARPVRRELSYTFQSTGQTKHLLVTFANVSADVVLFHAEDVSERMMLEEQLRSAQKMEAIGRLAGGVAHDFNNILSVILGYANLVTEDLPIDDPMRGDLNDITTAAERAVALTQQLLALGRRQVLQPCAIDLAEATHKLETMLRQLLGEGIELTIHAGARLGSVFADPTQIDQVFMNLVANARDAMPTGGRLHIELEDVVLDGAEARSGAEPLVGRYVRIVIRDSGSGMDTATAAKIFEPFFTTKEQGKGTGLGLATVFGIVRQSGGDVLVRSVLGEGTTFTVYLPRVDDERARQVTEEIPSAREPAPGGTETILVVEDDEQVRALACTVLRRQGYDVVVAHNGGDALLANEQHQGTIHLLLTDVVMPRMNGRVLAERLRALRPQMNVLFMSGYTDDAVVRHGILTSGLAFLQKPITPTTLAAKVRAVLDNET